MPEFSGIKRVTKVHSALLLDAVTACSKVDFYPSWLPNYFPTVALRTGEMHGIDRTARSSLDGRGWKLNHHHGML